MARSSESDVIDFYDPKTIHGEFSNFYPSPIVIDHVQYPTVEHYFQAQKFEDQKYRDLIISQKTAGKVKYLSNQKAVGRWKWQKDLNYDIDAAKARGVKMREGWDDIRVGVMIKGVLAKFLQHDKLRKKLLSTGYVEIREASPRDSYWGTARGGENMLGKIIMCVREVLRERKKKT